MTPYLRDAVDILEYIKLSPGEPFFMVPEVRNLAEEICRLRAELAAETRRADVLLEEKLWSISVEKENCAKIAENQAAIYEIWAPEYRMLHAVAAAIRARNAAPPQPLVEPECDCNCHTGKWTFMHDKACCMSVEAIMRRSADDLYERGTSPLPPHVEQPMACSDCGSENVGPSGPPHVELAPGWLREEGARAKKQFEDRMIREGTPATPHVEAAKTVTRPPHDRPHSHVETTGLTPAHQATFAKAHRNSVECVEPSAAEPCVFPNCSCVPSDCGHVPLLLVGEPSAAESEEDFDSMRIDGAWVLEPVAVDGELIEYRFECNSVGDMMSKRRWLSLPIYGRSNAR